jgi:hypothetical protein
MSGRIFSYHPLLQNRKGPCRIIPHGPWFVEFQLLIRHDGALRHEGRTILTVVSVAAVCPINKELKQRIIEADLQIELEAAKRSRRSLLEPYSCRLKKA